MSMDRALQIAVRLDSQRIDNVQRLDILTEMVLDLYAQNIALWEFIDSRLLTTGSRKGITKSATDMVANTIGREGYDETPDAGHLKRVALALKAL